VCILQKNEKYTLIDNDSYNIDRYMKISLGADCATAYQLKKNNLRCESSPFDWISTPNFKTIIDLINNNFYNFLENIIIIKTSNTHGKYEEDYQDSDTNSLVIKDTLYNLKICHDFQTFSESEILEIRSKYQKRINRFYNNLRSNYIDFIRWEPKPNSLIKHLQLFYNGIIKYCSHFRLTIIVTIWPESIKKPIWCRIIETNNIHTSCWKKNELDWGQILTEFRNDLVISYPQNNNYNDNFTHSDIIIKINKILNNNIYFTKLKIHKTNYNKFGIYLEIYKIINQNVLLNMFDVVKINDTYITSNKTLGYILFDKIYKRNLFSFHQVFNYLEYKVHNYVFYLLQKKSKNHYLGIGGECAVYSYYMKYTKNTITDSEVIFSDNLINKLTQMNLVNYSTMDLYFFVQEPAKTTILINIRKKGLYDNLTYQINKCNIDQIILINCDLNVLNKDIKKLDKYIMINQNIIKTNTQISVIITELKYNNISK
jgi:hypothetical protein